MSQALEGAGNKREEYWKNRIKPFWQYVWPKSRDLASDDISESLVRLSIAAGGEFPSAVTAVEDWLRPVEHPHLLLHLLHESALCGRFPLDSLRLLDAVIRGQQWITQELGQCLEAMLHAEPNIVRDRRYQRLAEYARRHAQ